MREPPPSEISLIGFLFLSILVNGPIYVFIYVLTSLFLIQYIFIPALVITSISYISGSFLAVMLGLLSSASVVLPFFIIAFITSRISSSIESLLDTPISQTALPRLYRITLRLLKLIFTTIPTILLLPLNLFQYFLTVILHVVQTPSIVLQFIAHMWDVVSPYSDPYAHLVLYQLPERAAGIVVKAIFGPWKVTQSLAEVIRPVLLFVGILVNWLGSGVSLIGRKFTRMGGAGHWMGARHKRDDGKVAAILIVLGYLVLDCKYEWVLTMLMKSVVSVIVASFRTRGPSVREWILQN